MIKNIKQKNIKNSEISVSRSTSNGMKKFSIFIFTILTLLTPVLFANAAETISASNIKSDSVFVEAGGLDIKLKEVTFSLSKETIGSSYSTLISDQTKIISSNGIANTTFTNLVPNTKYTIDVRYSFGSVDASLDSIEFTTPLVKPVSIIKIDSFSPIEGKEGDMVTITGGDFTGAGVHKVLFGLIESPNFNVASKTTIIAKVPAGAVDGKITVKLLQTGGIAKDLVSTDIFKISKISSGIDYSILDKTIIIATNLVTETKEGTAIGQYPVGSTNILNDSLRKIKDDYEFIKTNSQDPEIDINTIQTRVDVDVEELEEAINVFKSTIIKSISPSDQKSDKKTSEREGFWGKGSLLVPECKDGPCGFNEFMKLINNVIKFLLFTIATPLCALIVAYAGWLYISSSSSEENKGKAKKILTNVVVGYIIALAAFLIVKTLLSTLGASTEWLG
jgi:hypothetical protein